MVKRKDIPNINLWRLADVDRLFERLYAISPTVTTARRHWVPDADVYETKDAVIVKMDLAGVPRDAVKIILDEDAVVVTGAREEERHEGSEYFHQVEIAYGYFRRVIELPRPVASDKCRASYRDGILVIILPKAERPVSIHTTVEIL